MTPEQYQKEIQRTWQTDGLTWREQVCNATLGLVGETQEYIDSSLDPDELGDVFFYAYTLRRLLGGAHRPTERRISFLSELAPWVAEAVKKHVFHGAPPQRARELVEEMIHNLEDRAKLDCGGTAGDVLAANIAKLRARHPDGWDTSYIQSKEANNG